MRRFVVKLPKEARERLLAQQQQHVQQAMSPKQKFMVAVFAIWVGERLALSDDYDPQKAMQEQENLGLSPKEFVKFLESKDAASILGSDLLHLRAVILDGKMEKVRRSWLCENDENFKKYGVPSIKLARVGGPEMLVALILHKLPEAKKTSNLDKGEKCLVVFNPDQVDDHLIEANWSNIFDVYVDRVFSGENGENSSDMKETIRSHKDEIKLLPLLESNQHRRDKEVEYSLKVLRQNIDLQPLSYIENIRETDNPVIPEYFVENKQIKDLRNVVVVKL
eukprot:CAMPEP_0167770854 /NCGR_PEP_ID=MMETSP0110_2-20121227/18171_1 /TAXON_ID=629695 /ORGANISM="Gymnochlora sp., Strain CCMP2014" /LENGTH=278 /DNA_ID=CAMNT_0007660119 /DNA_START=149 /DNA_END=986 /DNA_ORIENTATION=+